MDSANHPTQDDRTLEFLRLLGQHERPLRGFILSLVPHWSDADDIAQEVRIRLWEQFDRYDRSKDFGVWARTIAYYQVLTHREKQSRRQFLTSSAVLEAIAAEIASAPKEFDAQQHAMIDCLEELPQAKRDLLMRYYSGDRTAREIAIEIGRSFDATRQAILRARLLLSDCVDKRLGKEGQP